MLTLTKAGKKGLDALFEGKKKSPLMIYLASAKCSDPRLGIKIKSPNPTDQIIKEEGFTFSIDPILFQRSRGITIDYAGEKLELKSVVKYALSNCALCQGCRKKEGYT